MTKAPGTVDFMPPESLANTPMYGPPMDVFSFAEVERRQQYLDKLRGEAEVLRLLVEECLDYDPAERKGAATPVKTLWGLSHPKVIYSCDGEPSSIVSII